MKGSKGMREYVVQATPLPKDARERENGMYSTLLVFITSFCNPITYLLVKTCKFEAKNNERKVLRMDA